MILALSFPNTCEKKYISLCNSQHHLIQHQVHTTFWEIQVWTARNLHVQKMQIYQSLRPKAALRWHHGQLNKMQLAGGHQDRRHCAQICPGDSQSSTLAASQVPGRRPQLLMPRPRQPPVAPNHCPDLISDATKNKQSTSSTRMFFTYLEAFFQQIPKCLLCPGY